jgi:hypothetical protein
MTTYVNPLVYDNGLLLLTQSVARLAVIPAGSVTAYADVVAAILGVTAVTVGAPATSGNGRKVTTSAIAGGTITADGTAARWALLDDADSRVLVIGNLISAKPVIVGNSYSLPTFDIVMPGLA